MLIGIVLKCRIIKNDEIEILLTLFRYTQVEKYYVVTSECVCVCVFYWFCGKHIPVFDFEKNCG